MNWRHTLIVTCLVAVLAGTGCRALIDGFPAMPYTYAGDNDLVWECEPNLLQPALLADLRRAAREYVRSCREPLRVVSGARTLRRQAELMAAMTPDQLEALYCRNGYPQYIRDLIAIHGRCGAVTPDQAHDVLSNRTEGYVSAHLSGAAVDLGVPRSDAHAALLRSILERHGFSVLDERSAGIPCIHATHIASPRRIVRD